MNTFKEILRKRIVKYPFYSALALLILFFAIHLLFPLKVDVNYSQLITADDGSVIHSFLSKDDKWRMKLTQEEISPQLEKAILFKEDKYFYYHPGVNLIAIFRAAFNNVFHLRRTSGASTIHMQVIRLLYPKKRSYGNKLVEMFRALQLEMKFSKKEILRLYLNLVPYGGNIEGIKSASLLYFGRMPDKLSLAQVTALAVIPNRPTSLRLGKNNRLIVQFRNQWLQRMKSEELFPIKEIEDALEEPLDAERQAQPNLAPHLANRLHKEYPEDAIVKTSLNRVKQQRVNTITYNYGKRLKNYGIYNSAVMVVDNKTRKILAYLGSPDFGDSENSGQVDGVTAIRSPGSTLKPLVYALAFDKGFLTPKRVITDVPVNYDGYAPENFNGHFNGNVTVAHALEYSLNVPAVKALFTLGMPTMIDALKGAGFEQTKHHEKKLGLSLVLGGCGVKLEELTALFCAFSNEGSYARLKFLDEDTVTVMNRIVSPSSAFMLSEILSGITRPDLPNNFESSIRIPKIAWKTGTSYGRRDAWSIGYNTRYTIGVWVGNFSGNGVPELSGAEMATPLLFEIFNSIDYNAAGEWFKSPAELDYRLVCPETGKLPEEFCEHAVMDGFIPGISSVEKCDHMKRVFTSADEKTAYCTSCVPANGYKEKYYPNISSDLVDFYESENIGYKKIPKHNLQCTRVFADNAPRIVSPVNKKEYLVEKGEGQLLLNCEAGNEVKTVYWYINDRLYKTAAAAENVFFMPLEGAVKISCSDDKGRNADIYIKVKYF